MTCLWRGLNGHGTVGSTYKGEYYTLVHTTYESSGPYGFGEEDFFYFSNCKSKGAIDSPEVGPFLTPGACFAGFM